MAFSFKYWYIAERNVWNLTKKLKLILLICFQEHSVLGGRPVDKKRRDLQKCDTISTQHEYTGSPFVRVSYLGTSWNICQVINLYLRMTIQIYRVLIIHYQVKKYMFWLIIEAFIHMHTNQKYNPLKMSFYSLTIQMCCFQLLLLQI